MKDWVGNSTSIFVNHGASNHSEKERAKLDYYATDPKAVKKLLEVENFSSSIWEPACGGGHISKLLINNGYVVRSSDIVDRGFENTYVEDFLKINKNTYGDIITNPPYKYAKEFVEHALDISDNKTKIAMFLKLTFLESEKRLNLFQKYPPKMIYVFSKRINCGLNGIFDESSSAVCYAWFVWEKGYNELPKISWI